MTIHTFEVSSILDNERYYNIQQDLKTDKDKWERLKNGMCYFGLSEKGITIKMYRIKKKGFYSYCIIYEISAQRVFDNDDHVGLFDAENYPKLKKKVNKQLMKKSKLLPKLDDCKLRRIDWCINIELESQEQVKAYIETVRRANIPAGMERYTINNKPTKDDMTVISEGYAAVSIYNKQSQMIKENKRRQKKIFSDKDIRAAEKIVRIEIRCFEGKVKALKKKHHISSIDDFMDYADLIGKDLYRYYLTKMFSNNEIYTLKEARERIELSGYKKDNRKLLDNFLTEANESRSAAKAMAFYKELYGDKEMKRILYMLEQIDVNYVTVTGKVSKQFRDGYIPTPYELFMECEF